MDTRKNHNTSSARWIFKSGYESGYEMTGVKRMCSIHAVSHQVLPVQRLKAFGFHRNPGDIENPCAPVVPGFFYKGSAHLSALTALSGLARLSSS